MDGCRRRRGLIGDQRLVDGAFGQVIEERVDLTDHRERCFVVVRVDGLDGVRCGDPRRIRRLIVDDRIGRPCGDERLRRWLPDGEVSERRIATGIRTDHEDERHQQHGESQDPGVDQSGSVETHDRFSSKRR